MKQIFNYILISVLFVSCSNNKNEFDASGTFEAIETIIPAQANGILTQFSVSEGQQLKVGQVIGSIDSTQLYLKIKQLQAQIDVVLGKTPKIGLQLAALRSQLEHAEHEYKRLTNLYNADAATGKQVDDAKAEIAVIENQLAAQRSSLTIASTSLKEETAPLEIQIAQLEDQLAKCILTNAINGTVLTTYVEPYEMATIGKPLYKIADLSNLVLRAYITGDQFATIHLNQKVSTLVDDGKGGFRTYEGIVEWISDKAEFTPKTIQTKDERANLVYAIKVKVKNDGNLKIGMYGEIKL